MKNQQPQKCNTVRDLQKTMRRDAVLEKLLMEVDMKIKKLKSTYVRFGNNCVVGVNGIFQRPSRFVNKILRLEIAISQIRNVAAALMPVGCKCGSVKMWELSMFLLPINHVFGTLVIRRIDEIFFLQVAELYVVLARVLSPVFRGAASHLRIGDGTGCSKDRALEYFVDLDILKSLERTFRLLGSADTLNTDNFEVVFIHVFHDIVQMVQELIEVMALDYVYYFSPSCIEDRVACGQDRDLKRFTNSGLLKSSQNGTRLLGPTATQINDDGFVLGINNLDKNCLGNTVAVEAGNGNLVEDCINEHCSSNAKDSCSTDDCVKEDGVLNDCSCLKGKFF